MVGTVIHPSSGSPGVLCVFRRLPRQPGSETAAWGGGGVSCFIFSNMKTFSHFLVPSSS